MTTPKWSVKSAQNLRLDVNERMAKKQRWLAPIASAPAKWAIKFRHSVLKQPVYQQRLKQVAFRMNQHADSAFDGYTPIANDIIAAAYFKAGTNLLMHICYQISERGEGDFSHIQDVMPWPDAAQPKFWMNLFDLSAYQSRTGRRVIKTHLPATKVPVNDQAKYIAVTRDPKDCAASGYYYFRSLIFGPTAPPSSIWLDHMASKDAPFGRWDVFTASWYRLRKQPNVLFMRFDEIKNNPVDAIKTIAAFLEIDLSEEAVNMVVLKTSFKEMKANNHRFFPAMQSLWTSVNGSIIRKGQSGDGVALFDKENLSAFDADMEQGLKALGSDFPYAQHYSLSAKAAND